MDEDVADLRDFVLVPPGAANVAIALRRLVQRRRGRRLLTSIRVARLSITLRPGAGVRVRAMKPRRVLKVCKVAVLWTGLCLMAVLVFGESRQVWRGRDICAQGQARVPSPAFSPADWQR